MSTDSTNLPSDVQLLHAYLGQRIQDEGSQIPLDSALEGFQEYYRQLCSMRDQVEQAIESLDRHAGGPLDVESLIRRVRKRLANTGVTG